MHFEFNFEFHYVSVILMYRINVDSIYFVCHIYHVCISIFMYKRSRYTSQSVFISPLDQTAKEIVQLRIVASRIADFTGNF